MKRYEICEVVKHYHLVEVDDEIDIEEIVEEANKRLASGNSACQLLQENLEYYYNRFGFNYKIHPDFCGTEAEEMSIIDEVD